MIASGDMMYKYLVLSLVAVVSFVVPAFAQSEDAKLLSKYEQEATLSAAGMCDSMRSTIVSYTGKTFTEMIEFVPVSNSKRFYVIKKESGDEYFIEIFAGEKGSSNVRKLPTMQWSQELMPESMNFFRFVFFPERKQHDCGLSKK